MLRLQCFEGSNIVLRATLTKSMRSTFLNVYITTYLSTLEREICSILFKYSSLFSRLSIRSILFRFGSFSISIFCFFNTHTFDKFSLLLYFNPFDDSFLNKLKLLNTNSQSVSAADFNVSDSFNCNVHIHIVSPKTLS